MDKVTVAYQRKIDLNGFFGKKICFEVFGPKGAQNEVFLVLSKVYAWNFPDFFYVAFLIENIFYIRRPNQSQKLILEQYFLERLVLQSISFFKEIMVFSS